MNTIQTQFRFNSILRGLGYFWTFILHHFYAGILCAENLMKKISKTIDWRESLFRVCKLFEAKINSNIYKKTTKKNAGESTNNPKKKTTKKSVQTAKKKNNSARHTFSPQNAHKQILGTSPSSQNVLFSFGTWGRGVPDFLREGFILAGSNPRDEFWRASKCPKMTCDFS